jgi:hypothetical protein
MLTRHKAGWVICACAILAAQETPSLGIFSNQGSVGQTPAGCKASFDGATGEYRITGGGANIWAATDEFYFVWKRVSGDVALSADVRFEGSSAAPHRKAVLMIRQDLDPGASYADAAAHGNGLTALQYRVTRGGQTAQVPTQVDGPVRLRVERHGDQFSMFAGAPGQELKQFGPAVVSMHDPVYIGLGVCSHVATTLETAIFSNVKIESAPVR